MLAYEDSFPEAYLGPLLAAHPSLEFQHLSYDTDADALEMLAQGLEVDVIAACVEETLGVLADGGYLRPFDASLIESWPHLHPAFKALPGVIRDADAWLVPVDAAPTGLMFDTTVRPSPKSFAGLFDRARQAPVAIDAKPTIALHVAALALGIPHPPRMDLEQLQTVTRFYIDLKQEGHFPLLWETHDDIDRLFRDHRIVASTGFPGDTLDLQRAGLPIDFAIASEGPMLWACGFGLARLCRNEPAAYAFLNYVVDPQSQAYLASEMNFMVSNTATAMAVSPDVRARAHLDHPLKFDGAPLPEPPLHRDAWMAAWRDILAA